MLMKSSSPCWPRPPICIWSSSAYSRGRPTFSWMGGRSRGECEGTLLFVATMSHLACSLLSSYVSIGVRSPGRGQPLAGGSELEKGLYGWRLIFLPSKMCLMSSWVLVFFTASRGCWFFYFFLFTFSMAAFTLGPLAFTFSASLARWCLPDVDFRTFRAGAGRPPHCS